MLKRDYPASPIVGVGALIWQGNNVLLIKRGKAPRLGEWSLPGGAQQLGETVFEAAIREVREETGIDVRITGVVEVIDLIDKDDDKRVKYHYTLVDVIGEYLSGHLQAGDDAADARWFTLETALSLVNCDETRQVLIKSAHMHADRKIDSGHLKC